MISTIYLEDAIAGHPRAAAILDRFSQARVIRCQRYTEVFNRKAQNFRLQKLRPALILAEKLDNHLIPAPDGYHIGSEHNYYFSHMLNCLYDCRYCFLQGMYRSANYVLFVNYESFTEEIVKKISRADGQNVHFFSGYDCDSLAFEPVSGFAQTFVPLFEKHPSALLELRTKSTQIRYLLDRTPLENVITAFSLSPENVSVALEHKTPSLDKRLEAIGKLQERGWKIGLRFDPIILQDNYRQIYARFFTRVFTSIDVEKLHSVSLGSFRLPTSFFNTVSRLYPEEKLFSSSVKEKDGMMSYPDEMQSAMLKFCKNRILQYVPEKLLFPCSY